MKQIIYAHLSVKKLIMKIDKIGIGTQLLPFIGARDVKSAGLAGWLISGLAFLSAG